MIESIHIKNFKSWKDQKIDFSEGVNVIKGTSHTGKSNIYRALEWALTNSPNRDEFGSVHEPKNKNTSVRVIFSDGQFIERGRKGTKNYYIANEHEPEAFRFDVPRVVFDAAIMDERNLIDQHTKFTLISDSPGEVGRVINQISGLAEADKYLKNANKCLSSHSDKLKESNKSISDQEVLLGKYDFVEGFVEEVEEIEEVEKNLQVESARISNLEKLLEQQSVLEEELLELEFIEEAEEEVRKASELAEESESLGKDIKRLEGLLNNLSKISEFLEDTKDVGSDLEEIDKLCTEIDLLDSGILQLSEPLERIKKLEASVVEAKSKITGIETEIIDILGEMEICPVCDSVIEL